MEFFRFPRTPHLAWLADGDARDDKVLSPDDARELLSGVVVIEEKVDGANVGLSVSETGEVQAQNRGAYIDRETCHPQFKPLFRWLETHRFTLLDQLAPHLILFGEWCYAVHTVQYTQLPDWFLAFDVYDRQEGDFWSTIRRDRLVDRMGLSRVPWIAQGQFTLPGVIELLGPSRVGDTLAEGAVVRREDERRLIGRAKIVRPEFVQHIDAHWSGRTLQVNRLRDGVWM